MNRREKIREYIAEIFYVSTDFAVKKRRDNTHTFPKKLFTHVLYYKEEMKLKEIAAYMGYSDHATIIHHLRSFDGLYDTDDLFKELSDRTFAKHYELLKNENINQALQLPAQEDTLCVLADSDLPND